MATTVRSAKAGLRKPVQASQVLHQPHTHALGQSTCARRCSISSPAVPVSVLLRCSSPALGRGVQSALPPFLVSIYLLYVSTANAARLSIAFDLSLSPFLPVSVKSAAASSSLARHEQLVRDHQNHHGCVCHGSHKLGSCRPLPGVHAETAFSHSAGSVLS